MKGEAIETREHEELRLFQVELEVQHEELERAHALVSEARDRYRDLYQLSPVAYLTVSRDGRVVEANRAAELLLARTEEQLCGHAFAQVLSEEDADCWHLHLRRAFAMNCKQRCELRIRREDGTWSPVLVDSIVDSKRHQCLSAFIDLTEQRKVELEMQEAVARFHQLTGQIEDVFFICGRSSGGLLYISPGVERLTGLSPSAFLEGGQRLIDRVHGDDRERVRGGLSAFKRGAAPFDLEFRIARSEGELRWVRVRAFPVPGEDRIAGIATDVTEERRMEEELRHAQKMEAVGELASGIAHDFNNLLMGIIGFATITARALESGHPAQGTAKRVSEIATRGTSLTRQLLDFSRKRGSDPTALELDGVVSNSKALLETLVGESVRVMLRCQAGRCRVRADAGEIEQMLMNLATNARDAMPKGGTLSIATKEVVSNGAHPVLRAGRYATLTVRDNGLGMDANTRRRIFEPFFTTKAPGHGTGLGLATTFAIVRRMGGEIAVESTPGEGTSFIISLPVLPETAELALDDLAPRGEGAVLVVEDDPFVRESVAHYLSSVGYEPVLAEDAHQALRLVEQRGGEIRILLTDVVMPHRFGRDLAAEVRSRLPAVDVVYMSAHPREELLERGRIEPNAVLIQKPFDELRLAFTLRSVASPHSQSSGGRLLIQP